MIPLSGLAGLAATRYFSLVSKPFSSAASATMVLKVDPAWYDSWVARLIWGRSFGSVSRWLSAAEIFGMKQLGSYVGTEASASTSPEWTSITTAAPRVSGQ